MKRLIIPLLAATALCACSHRSPADEQPALAVSIGPQKFLLEQIVGDGFRIITIMDENASPETFEPSMSRRMEADRAEAYFTVGLMPFEEGFAKSMESAGVPIVDTSEGIELMYGTHEHHHDEAEHHHGEGAPDPHVWNSVRNARIMARNMLQAVCALRPDSCEVYSRRAEVLDSLLADADARLESRLADGRKSFAIWHPSLSYFARDYGLDQLPIDPETKEISMQQRRHIVDAAREHGIDILFVQRQYDTRQAQAVNDAIGATLVSINPMNPNLIEELQYVADQLAK